MCSRPVICHICHEKGERFPCECVLAVRVQGVEAERARILEILEGLRLKNHKPEDVPARVRNATLDAAIEKIKENTDE